MKIQLQKFMSLILRPLIHVYYIEVENQPFLSYFTSVYKCTKIMASLATFGQEEREKERNNQPKKKKQPKKRVYPLLEPLPCSQSIKIY